MTVLQSLARDELHAAQDAAAGDDKRFMNSGFYRRARALELADGASAASLHRDLLLAITGENESKVSQLRYPDALKRLIRADFQRINREAGCKPDEHYNIERHALRCDYRIACFARIPAGVEHLEIGGIPRSLLYRGNLRQAISFTECMLVVRNRLPFYNIHLRHGIKPWTFLMVYTRDVQKQLYCNIVDALKMNPAVRGLVATSWWYDPQLVGVSPHMAFLREEMEQGGAYIFRYKRQVGHSLVHSSSRQSLFEQGQYQPCSYTAIWPRDRMIKWAERLASRTDEG